MGRSHAAPPTKTPRHACLGSWIAHRSETGWTDSAFRCAALGLALARQLGQALDEGGLDLGDEGEDLLALLVADACAEGRGHVLTGTLGGVGSALLQGGEQEACGALFG